jgi:predicted DNA-binding WGR domain protein
MASLFPSIYLERRDPARNMARFYALSIERDLLGVVIAVRRWGRIGTHGRSITMAYGDIAQARSDLLAVLAGKRRRGYRPVAD